MRATITTTAHYVPDKILTNIEYEELGLLLITLVKKNINDKYKIVYTALNNYKKMGKYIKWEHKILLSQVKSNN